MTTKGFQVRGNKNNPYHFSVGAVVIKDGNIALLKKPDDSITLPRETLYSKESIENNLARGLEEELGVIVKVKKYLGSIQEYFYRPDKTRVEKTTAYFLVIATKNTKRNPQKDEMDDEIMWLSPSDALKLLKSSNNKEYKIVQRAKP